MLTHVLANMSSAPWVSSWITKQLGEDYTYCDAKDDVLALTLKSGEIKEVTLGAIVKWFQRQETDEESLYLLYTICMKYDAVELQEMVRKSLAHVMKCKVGPVRSEWDGGLCSVVWVDKPTEKDLPFLLTRDAGDGGLILKWLPSKELHSVFFTHLKNTAVRTKNV